ncbi:MAG: hypothetical protein M9908_10725 [Phyllobacteriaceae bacterium]|nr:hypothetical protein [Phyllobacteriaceae bacterium]
MAAILQVGLTLSQVLDFRDKQPIDNFENLLFYRVSINWKETTMRETFMLPKASIRNPARIVKA